MSIQTRRSAIGIALTTTMLGGLSGCGDDRMRHSDASDTRATLAALPLTIEANHGQLGVDGRFLVRGAGVTAAFRDDSAQFHLRRGAHRADVVFEPIGARDGLTVAAGRRLPGVVNSYLGTDPDAWKASIPTFATVRYGRVWPKTDVRFHGARGELEYDVVLRPGADPGRVAFQLRGGGSPRITSGGELVLPTPAGPIVQRAPIAFQRATDGTRHPVVARFELSGERIGFSLGSYDRSQTLVIDPGVRFATYLGDARIDFGAGVATDREQDIYVGGSTGSVGLPADGGCSDLFVTKLKGDGTQVLYTTLIGGVTCDISGGVAVDSVGLARIAGSSEGGYPTTAGVQLSYGGGATDGVVTQLTASGSLDTSTYLGGSGADEATSVAIDQNGAGSTDDEVYVVGNTTSTNYPNTTSPAITTYQPANGGGQDVFFTKLGASLAARRISTYLGGIADDSDPVVAIAADAAYIAGTTKSANFPTRLPMDDARGGPSDGFITAFFPAGSTLEYSTYLGGGADDAMTAIDVADGNEAVVAGWSDGSFPTTVGAVQPDRAGSRDAVVTRVNAAGSALTSSTYLGGTDADQARGLTIDSAGRVLVVGFTDSTDFPTVSPAEAARTASPAGFVTRYDAAGSELDHSTYLNAGGGFANAVATFGAITDVVVAGTASGGLAVKNAVHPNPANLFDAYVVRYDLDPSETTITAGPSGTVEEGPQEFSFTATEAGSTFECRVAPAAFATCTSPTTVRFAAGEQTFEVRAIDGVENPDPSPASRTLTVTATPAPAPEPEPTPAADPADPVARVSDLSGVAPGERFTLDASASTGDAPLRYEWDLDADGTYEQPVSTSPQVTSSFEAPGLNFVGLRVSDARGRQATATASVDVSEPIDTSAATPRRTALVGERVTFEQHMPDDSSFTPAYYMYDFGDGSAPASDTLDGQWRFYGREVSRSAKATHTYTTAGYYEYKLTTVAADAQIAELGGVIEIVGGAKATANTGSGDAEKKPIARPGADYTGPPVTIERTGVGTTNPLAPPLKFDVRSKLDQITKVKVGEKKKKTAGGFKIVDVFEEHVTVRGGDVTYFMGDGALAGTDPQTGMRVYKGETVYELTKWKPDQVTNEFFFRYDKPGTYDVRVLYKTPSRHAKNIAKKLNKPPPASHGTAYASIEVLVQKPLCGNFKFEGIFVGISGECFEPTGDGGFHGRGSVFVNNELSVRAGRWDLKKDDSVADDQLLESLPIAIYPSTGAITTLPGVHPEQEYGDATPLRVNFSDQKSFKVGKVTVPKADGKSDSEYREVGGLSEVYSGKDTFQNLPIVGRTVSISPSRPGQLATKLKLPEPFSGTSLRIFDAKKGQKRAAGRDASGQFHLEGGPLGFGPIQVIHFSLQRDAYGWLHGGGEFELFGSALRADDLPGKPHPQPVSGGPSGFGIDPDGHFRYGGATFEPLSPLPLGPLGITSITANLTIDPFFFRGELSVQFPSVGTPLVTAVACIQMQEITAEMVKAHERFFVCKGSALTPLLDYGVCLESPIAKAWIKGPKDYCDALSEPATAEYFLLHFEGSVTVLGEEIGSGYFQLRTGDEKELRAGVAVKYEPVPAIYLEGGVEGYAKFRKDNSLKAFQVYGHIHGSVADLLDVNLEGVVNNKYAAGCAGAEIFGAEVGYIGAWYRFSDDDWGVFGGAFSGCNLKKEEYYIKPRWTPATGMGSLDAQASALPVTQQEVVFPADLPVGQIIVTGDGGMPIVEVDGPGGYHYRDPGTPPTLAPKASAVALHVKERNQAVIYIPTPRAGTYTVRALRDGAPISALSTAHGRRQPILRGVVKHRGGRYVLDYLVENDADTSVTFSEEVDGIPSEIGDARPVPRGGARAAASRTGHITLDPKLGASGKRNINAWIVRDGIPERMITIGSYNAPSFGKSKPPRRVRTRVRGSVLTVSWDRIADARGYLVRARTSDGTDRTIDVTAGRTSARVRGFARTESATIDVRATDRHGRTSPPRRARVRARAKLPLQVVGRLPRPARGG